MESKKAKWLRDESFACVKRIVELESDLSLRHEEVKRLQHEETINAIFLSAAAWRLEEWFRRGLRA